MGHLPETLDIALNLAECLRTGVRRRFSSSSDNAEVRLQERSGLPNVLPQVHIIQPFSTVPSLNQSIRKARLESWKHTPHCSSRAGEGVSGLQSQRDDDTTPGPSFPQRKQMAVVPPATAIVNRGRWVTSSVGRIGAWLGAPRLK
ncbi:hypothetical protein HPB51_022008 [Rhipicephalus microplus]|uniref:Uncharacterized protein n=1 Tax=Rhipicephalus microplus TaxID=6941 RepID=A0A9J6DJN5_RHIMP|nr:hypothetical protein HPB51_022008 [Rhipicephalus microplus]